MKKVTILIAALFMVVAASQAQSLQSIFEKYGNDEHFEYVSVGKGMMNLGGLLGGIAKDDKEMMSKMRSVKILSLEGESNASLMKALETDLDKVLAKGNFETAVEVRDKGERVNVYYRVSDDNNADMLIVSKEKNEFSLIWISGKMSKEEMMKSFSDKGQMVIGLS
ncbi:MAG: DUF4252 domain-containing protein [Paludibacter sp.]